MPADLVNELAQATQIYGPLEIVINITLSILLGLVVAILYRLTPQGTFVLADVYPSR